MQILHSTDDGFSAQFDKLVCRSEGDSAAAEAVVNEILNDIKNRGDEALFEQTAKFDRWQPNSKTIKISEDEMKEAFNSLPTELAKAMRIAIDRVKKYHEMQVEKSWLHFEDNGSILGQKVTAVDRAGLYIPGGKAAYPSSLIMNAVPAIVAGVKEIVVCTPAIEGRVNNLLLAAMSALGIKIAYKLGGASAIGAMAFGSQSIKKVDVITGPGNIYVATAKKICFGAVNIDMVAGPSEIGVIADDSADATIVAADLLSQAEHDEIASSFLITTSEKLASSVASEIERLLKGLEREKIARASIENKAAIIIAKNSDEAASLMNELAVEHLEIATDDAISWLPKIRHAGAIFLGHYTPEAMGDYLAGPNHTLPTGGSARFFSPLGVSNFVKKSSIISLNEAGFNELSAACIALANAEGLGAHALSVQSRVLAEFNKNQK